MRVIWLLGEDARAKKLLEQQLTPQARGVDYRVRLVKTLEEIPEDHIMNPGVTILLDAFHPTLGGFEGLKTIRSMGFEGPVFLFGEPSPDLAVMPFRTAGLSGYFPSLDRADFNFVSGLIHYRLNFVGDMDLTHFLKTGGRSSSEVIKSFRDFNAFGMKLATFVGRFGVDIAQLKKVLMGLCLGHVKTGSGAPVIDNPFTIHYGMDPNKVMLAVSTFSRGATQASVLNDFCEVLAGLKNQKALPGTIFPEFYHVGRAAENLILLCGSAQSTSDSMDPMMLLTAIAFPNVNDKKQAPIGVFAFAHVLQTAEIASDGAAPPTPTLEESVPTDAVSLVEAPPAAEGWPEATNRDPGNAEAHAAKAPEAEKPSGTLQSVDLNDILEDPKIIGDVPHVNNPDKPVTGKWEGALPVAPIEKGSVLTASADVSAELAAAQTKATAAETELKRLKDVCAAMSLDVRRLMKERRQPTTDRELRDAVTGLEEKLKKVTAEKLRSTTEIAERDKQIETLKAQVDALRRAKAA